MAILKDLIVHGSSHFIGKVFINDSHIMKINGSDVPENPKFTDTIASATTTGTGNAITDVNVNNGSFTFTKGSTFLTSQNTAALFAGASSGTSNAATTNGNTYLILQDGANYSRRKISGTDLTKVTSDANGNISISTKFDNQQANKFFGGPSSGSAAAPNFREIELEDLPHDTTITEGSNSQNLPTTQAVAAYVDDKIDNLQIEYDQVKDSNNLIIDGENPVLDPVFARPRIKGDDNSYVRFSAGTQSVVPHGVKITNTEAVRPFITFGSSVIGEGTLCGLTPGSTYTFSCKLKYKILSGGDTSTRYLRMYLMTNKANPSKFESENYVTVQSLSTLLHGVEVASKGTLTFTVPLEATKVYLLIACNQTTTSCYAAGDYIEATEFKLEEGSIATLWENKSDLKIGGRNYFAICNSVKGYLYPDGTIHAEDNYKEYTCDYIPVSKGEVFTLSTKTLSQDDQPYLAYRFFDSEKNPIGVRTAGYVKCISNIEVPDGAAYIRASYRTHNGTATGKLELGSIPTDWTPAPEDLMEEIDTAKGIANTALQNIEEVETMASTALKEGPEFILGTHISNSSLWTGESRDSALFQGKTINYQLSYTGISGSPTLLRLLLANGNTTGDIVLIDNAGNTISDQYPAGSILSLVYDTEGVPSPPVWRVQGTTRKIEEDQISISATNDTIPTSLAVKNTIDKLPIIGRNLLRRTGGFSPSDFVLTRSTVQTSEILRLTPTTSAAYAKFRVDYLDYADFENKTFTASLDVRKADVSSSYTTDNNVLIYVGVSLSTRLANLFDSGSDRYRSKSFTGITSQWQRVSFTFTVPDDLTTGKTAALAAGNYFTVQVAESGSRSPIEIRHVKLEEGAWATDWTRAPEDFSLGIVTPQMFGAKANGIDDDTFAIQTALDSSFHVYMPEGTYLITHSLIVRSGTHLEGTSTHKTILKVSENFSNTNSNYHFAVDSNLDNNRRAFLQEEGVGNYVIQVIESIRAARDYYASSSATTPSRVKFAGDLSTFLIQNFTINCNDTYNNGTKVAVGGLHLFRPYNKCALRGVYVDRCTCRAIFVGDEVSYTWMQNHYAKWIAEENIADEDEGSLIKMLRRRTRSQTLVIQNCHFSGSKAGTKFDPSHFYKYDTSTNQVLESSSATTGYAQYAWVLWRPHHLVDYTWKKLVANDSNRTSPEHFAYMSNGTDWPKDPTGTEVMTAETMTPDDSKYYGKYTNDEYNFTYDHGSEALGIEANTPGSVKKRQLGGNVWIGRQTDTLMYIYNSFELNLKDTKVMFSSVNFKSFPAAVFNNCTDLYVRGCSFTGTLGEAIRIVGPTKYFRLIGNTYEVTGVVPDGDTNNITGGGFATMGIHNLYQQKTSASGDPTKPLYPEEKCVINCKGLYSMYQFTGTDTQKINAANAANAPYENPSIGSTQIVAGGVILETTYNNTPRRVKLLNTNQTLIMGSFTREDYASENDSNTLLIDSVQSRIKAGTIDSLYLYKSYTVSMSNLSSSVGGFTTGGSVALNIPEGYVPIGAICTTNTATTAPAVAFIKNNMLQVYSNSTYGVTVRVTFGRL